MDAKRNTAAAIPPEIRVEPLLPDGARYLFPRRTLGAARFLGLIPLLFGFAFSGFAVFWIVAAFVMGGGAGGGVLGLLFPLFGVPFVFAGLIPMFVGFAVLAGRSEIVIQQGKLRATEWAGPMWWSRSRPVQKISRLVVAGGLSAAQQPALNMISAINAQLHGGGAMFLAPGYPRDWLEAVARDLAEHCDADFSSASAGKKPAVDVVDVFQPQTNTSPTGVAPAETDIRCDQHTDGVTFDVPAAGLWKGSKGLFPFSLVWCGFMTVFSGIFGVVAINEAPWFVFLFVALFWLIGIGMLLGAINMGRRRSALVVVGDSLMVLRKGIFGSKRGEWRRDEIAWVKVGPSGVEVNNQPIMELQIIPKAGPKFGMLSERNDDELRWIAAQLRKALRLSRAS